MGPSSRPIGSYNPYVVYPSLVHTFSRMIGAYQLERMTTQEIEDNVLSFYEKMMRAYWGSLLSTGPVVGKDASRSSWRSGGRH